MDPALTAALVGGGLDFLGGLATNASNARNARDQMDFQDRMSSTAYQRATSDMRKAGINPLMAYAQGGASTPQGSAARSENPLSRASHSARAVMENKLMQGTLDKTQSEIRLNEAAAAREASVARLNEVQTILGGTNARIAASRLPEVENLGRVHDSFLGRYVLAPFSAASSAVGSAFSGVNSALGLKRLFGKSY